MLLVMLLVWSLRALFVLPKRGPFLRGRAEPHLLGLQVTWKMRGLGVEHHYFVDQVDICSLTVPPSIAPGGMGWVLSCSKA